MKVCIYQHRLLLCLILLSTFGSLSVGLKLDDTFHELFSLSHIYDQVKLGDLPSLRTTFLFNYDKETTATLLYGLARAFTRSKIENAFDYKAKPYLVSGLDESVCQDKALYDRHQQNNIQCHFRKFVTCVEGILERPENCLSDAPAARAACPQALVCNATYYRLAETESRAWLQLWAAEAMSDLKFYQNFTPAQIALMSSKTCLHDSQFLSAVYNLALCSEISRQSSLAQPRVVHPLAEIYCPDPCLRNPCQSSKLRYQLINTECSTSGVRWESRHTIAHEWSDFALQYDYNKKPEYTCSCRYGQWSLTNQACERITGGDYRTCSPTLANRYFPCDAEGTSSCYDNKDSEEVPFVCRCKEGFVGIFCQERINTCVNSLVSVKLPGFSERMTGNRMCNVNHGGQPIYDAKKPVNTCQPDPESRVGYNCTCVKPFYRLIKLAADNCLGFQQACDSALCVNGECISTPDMRTNRQCRCHNGWAGDMCDIELQDWTIWSACKPVCGFNRVRKRERRGDRENHARLYEEIDVCPNRPCSDDTAEIEYVDFQTLMHSSAANSATLGGCVLLALLSFAGLRFWRPRFAARELKEDN